MRTKLKDSPGARLILKERRRQVTREKWSAEHDDGYGDGQLALAGAAYAIDATDFRKNINRLTRPVRLHVLEAAVMAAWPWCRSAWKPTPKNRVKQLAKAGALIAAEIDRLERKSKRKP